MQDYIIINDYIKKKCHLHNIFMEGNSENLMVFNDNEQSDIGKFIWLKSLP